MQVYKIFPQGLKSNTYIITADGKSVVIVDPSDKGICKILDDYGLECKYVLLTHGHFDHVGGCGALFEKGAHICCGENEKDLIFSKEYLGIFGGVTVPHFEISRTFKDGEIFDMCGITFKAIETPGHTAGGMCYLADDALFTGDTLFYKSVGRTDLPWGNYFELRKSLKKLCALDGDFKIYCGHGESTTLDLERKYNPYLRSENA